MRKSDKSSGVIGERPFKTVEKMKKGGKGIGALELGGDRFFSKIFYPVKGKIICIVGIIGASQSVIESSPGSCNDIIVIKNPINVLEASIDGIRMAQNNRTNCPFS
jgi:hypothetical protein